MLSAAELLEELRHAEVRLTLHGDGLRVGSGAGALSAELRVRIVAARGELAALLRSALRDRLRCLALAERVPVALVDALADADVTECEGLPDEKLRAYVRALHRGRVMEAGEVPEGYTRAVRCDGCGPVWVWPGAPARLAACPWCVHRRAGRVVPQATAEEAGRAYLDGKRRLHPECGPEVRE